MVVEIREMMKEREAKGRALGRAEGLEQGLARGQGQGAAAVALSLMQKKFGTVPRTVRAQVEGASVSELTELATAIQDAESLDELLRNGGLH